jgi:hypothetical protein
LLNKIWFERKIITYVKDDGSNLNAMTFVLKSIISCETLGLQESFNGICFGHVFSKACQYATIDEKVCRNIRYVSIKAIQANLQKVYYLAQNFWKG